jgi:hypothetical protein
MTGIFLWALQGLYRLMQNGRFTHSDKSREASKAYQIEQNSNSRLELLKWSGQHGHVWTSLRFKSCLLLFFGGGID